MTQQEIAGDGSRGGLTLDYAIDLLLQNRWLVILTTAVVTLLGFIYGWFATPIYKVDALLQVELPASTLPSLEDFAELRVGKPTTRTEVPIIRSRFVVGEVVRQLKLDIRAYPRYFPFVGATIASLRGNKGLAPPLLKLDSYAWGGEKLHIERLDASSALTGISMQLTALGEGRFQLETDDGRLLGTGEVGQSLEVDLEETPDSPDLVLFIDQLVARPSTRFVVEKVPKLRSVAGLQSRLVMFERGGEGSGVIAVEMQGSNPSLTAKIINSIADFYVRQNVERRSEQARKSLKFVEEQLPKVRAKTEAAEARRNDYRLKHRSVDLTIETRSQLDKVVGLENQLSTLSVQRAELSEVYTDRHPALQSVDAKIRELSRRRQTLETQLQSLPETQQEILRLSRDVEVNTALYTLLLNKLETLRIVNAGTVGSARIIDYAEVPRQPIAPNMNIILIISAFLGLTLGLMLVILRTALTRGITDPREIEARLGLNVYATIPHSVPQAREVREIRRRKKGGDQRWPTLVRHAPRDLASESLRSFRTSIHFALGDADSNIVLITGPTQGVGKSFISINLANLMAMAGQKTLLIDADMRRGKLNHYVDGVRTPGLSDVLVGENSWQEAVRVTEDSNFHFMPAGTIPPNPSELLMSQTLSQFIKEAQQEYDLVVIDTPPVLAVTDASVLARASGARAFIVLRATTTPMRELESTVKWLEQSGVEIAGCVVNDVEQGHGYYGNYYRYSYGYHSPS